MADPAIQRAALRGVRSLPKPLLRLMAGGAVVYRGGRTLDPRLQFLQWQARGRPRLGTLAPPEARLVFAQTLKTFEGPLEPGVAIETLRLDTESGLIDA